jgi:hypothetical protein
VGFCEKANELPVSIKLWGIFRILSSDCVHEISVEEESPRRVMQISLGERRAEC